MRISFTWRSVVRTSDTPEKIKKAAEESLKAGHVFYTSNYGTPALRAAIAEWENAHNGANYEAANVMVTIGVSEATWCAMDAYLEKGDEVLVPNPVWLNYIHVPRRKKMTSRSILRSWRARSPSAPR